MQGGSRGGKQFYPHALFLCLVHLFGCGRHLVSRPPVDDGHFGGPQADCRAGRVDRSETSANDQRPAQWPLPNAGVALSQKLHGRESSLALAHARYAAGRPALSADGQEHGGVALGLQVFDGEVLAQAGA